MEMPNKYPEYDYSRLRGGLYELSIRLHEGGGKPHAEYLYKMSYKHPILYFLFYRWWVPSLLVPFEREICEFKLSDWQRDGRQTYWTVFSLHHPVQFMLLLFAHRVFMLFKKLIVKLLAAPVKAVRRLLRLPALGTLSTDAVGVHGGKVGGMLGGVEFVGGDPFLFPAADDPVTSSLTAYAMQRHHCRMCDRPGADRLPQGLGGGVWYYVVRRGSNAVRAAP